MNTYVVLAKWTDQGVRQINESPARLDAGKALLKQLGGEFKAFFMTMGEYDNVAVVEAPDDAVMARYALTLSEMGFIRTTTLRAFPEASYREIIDTLT